mmetsp:Transcript_1292/g.3893  ORF Transcript_1292/g.3893 Transcript_1292/m.3893 type:complete len:102 (+) Transcript_1292:222-527(+)
MRVYALLMLLSAAGGARPRARPRAVQRRHVVGAFVAAAAVVAPATARAEEAEVNAEMLANIAASREAWKKNATRRGFAFEAGASMPFVKEGTVGAPPRDSQ